MAEVTTKVIAVYCNYLVRCYLLSPFTVDYKEPIGEGVGGYFASASADHSS